MSRIIPHAEFVDQLNRQAAKSAKDANLSNEYRISNIDSASALANFLTGLHPAIVRGIHDELTEHSGETCAPIPGHTCTAPLNPGRSLPKGSG